MPTTVRTLNYVSPDAAGLSPIALPDATEMALYANSHVKNWWRADAGVDATNKKWRCRKTDAALVPTKTAFMTQKILLGTTNTPTVTAGGTGYTTATVTYGAPPAGGVQATGTATISGGVVTAIVPDQPGSGYITAPAITITGDGAGATATCTLDADGPYNGKECMVFGTGAGTNGALYDGGLNLLPTNASFSVVVVGRQGPNNDAGMMWANGLTSANAGSIYRGYGLAGGFNSYAITSNGSNLVNSTSGGGKYANGPRVDLASFDDVTNEVRQTLAPGNFTQAITKSGSIHVTNGEFHLGDLGPIASTQSAGNYIEGGDVAEVMIFDVALGLSANAALWTTVRDYLGARYGITVP